MIGESLFEGEQDLSEFVWSGETSQRSVGSGGIPLYVGNIRENFSWSGRD